MEEGIADLRTGGVAGKHVPRTVDQVFHLTRNQFREYLASRRFVVLVGIVVVIGAILAVVLDHFRSSQTGPGGLLSGNLAYYGSIWGGAAPFMIVLAAIFFGGDAIAGEFQNKTGYFLMGLPIRRATVYVGKYIAALCASIAVLGVWFLITLGLGSYFLGAGSLPWQILPSVALAIVYLMAVLGATFLFSSLFKVSAYGFVLTALLFLIGFTIIQELVSDLVKMEPWMVISYADGAIGEVFSTTINWGISGTSKTTVTPTGPGHTFTSTTYTPGVAEGLVIMLAYFVLTAIAGLLLFEREEFT